MKDRTQKVINDNWEELVREEASMIGVSIEEAKENGIGFGTISASAHCTEFEVAVVADIMEFLGLEWDGEINDRDGKHDRAQLYINLPNDYVLLFTFWVDDTYDRDTQADDIDVEFQKDGIDIASTNNCTTYNFWLAVHQALRVA